MNAWRAREREANTRRDYAHKVARRLVNGADVIALEKIKPISGAVRDTTSGRLGQGPLKRALERPGGGMVPIHSSEP